MTTDDETLLCNGKEWTVEPSNKLDESQRPYAEGKKAALKDYVLYDSIYKIFGKDNCRVMRTDQWPPGLEMEG